MNRFSYVAILAGMNELNELEQSESLFNESDTDLSTASDNESDEKLSESLEDITWELKQRAESAANIQRT